MNKCRPPPLIPTTVCSLLKSLYPFWDVDSSSVQELTGYEDRNYYFRGRQEIIEDAVGCSDSNRSRLNSKWEEFVFKVSHLTNSCELLEGVNEVMDHLRCKEFDCSSAIVNRHGKKISLLSDNQLISGNPTTRAGRSAQYPVRVLTYIPGVMVEDMQMTHKLAYDIGELAGRVDKALLDFSHPVLSNRTFACSLWDLRNFLQIKTVISPLNLNCLRRRILETTMSNFEENLQPFLPSFSLGMLHNDIGPQNIVKIKDGLGIIDFGDCMHNCHLFELAITIHGFLSHCNTSKDTEQALLMTAPLVAGYTHTFPLSGEEMGCLYYAVLARMCVGAIATELNLQVDPENAYLHAIVQQSWRGGELFFSHSKHEMDQLWSNS